ncbi:MULTISPECIES: HD domain-containing phosphohydrolase [unclassified Paenibacillus]|uniref:HD-GYP domain-containing protein n=1 Tax=unclassified Paenibacillus TaxID=185978 RepID=UPI001044FB7D|nr:MULTISPECIES: HD domain-containing phosphohydrolase [unclassified Paenibacillus]NIK66963.1 putative nucleotidyltransferase with HDIG domain [Paenibacillus sp. BK720]TCN01012.1 putative nucleotidyltransferase with HDIG domain [Paenibacillus sp. BK033]
MYDVLLDSQSLFLQLFNMYNGEQEWEKGKALFVSISCRDLATANHSLVVGYIAYHITINIRLASCNAERMFLAGLLHDIGKLSMPDSILKSSQRLNTEERKLVIEHVKVGHDALKQLDFGPDILQFCYSHHERLDGSGYPQGTTNLNEIGCIAAISDIYSALKLPRSYRSNCLSDKEIIEFLFQYDNQFNRNYTYILKSFLNKRSSNNLSKIDELIIK